MIAEANTLKDKIEQAFIGSSFPNIRAFWLQDERGGAKNKFIISGFDDRIIDDRVVGRFERVDYVITKQIEIDGAIKGLYKLDASAKLFRDNYLKTQNSI